MDNTKVTNNVPYNTVDTSSIFSSWLMLEALKSMLKPQFMQHS